jgi:hypothetical protein
MARRHPEVSARRAEVDVRGHLVDYFAERYDQALDFDERCRTDPEFIGQPCAHLYRWKLDALEAGEAVVVYRWQLPKAVRESVPWHRVTVGPAGELTEAP